MKKVVKNIKLAIYLPLLIFALFAIGMIGVMVYDSQLLERNIERTHVRFVTEEMISLQRTIAHALFHDQLQVAEKTITLTAVKPEVKHLLVVDDTQKVLISTNFSFKNKNIQNVMSYFNITLSKQVQQKNQPHFVLDKHKNSIFAYYPVPLTLLPHEVRSNRLGTIFLEYDLTESKANLWHQLMIQSTHWFIVTFVIMLILIYALHRFVISPLKILKSNAERLAQGKYGVQNNFQGTGEIFELAKAFDSMSQQLYQNLNALHSSEEKLATTLNSIGDAVIATDTLGRIVRMNPIAERLTGWSIEEAKEIPIQEVFRIVNAETHAVVRNPVEKVLQSKTVVGLANHTVLVARNGKEYQISDSAAPIIGKDGKLQGVVMVFRDVTEEYNLHKALRNSELRHRTVIESISDAIITITANKQIYAFNPAAELMFKQTERQVRGRLIQHFIPDFEGIFSDFSEKKKYQEDDSSNLSYDSESEDKSINDLFKVELEIYARDIHYRQFPIELTINQMFVQNERYFILIIRDISERKEAESKIMRLALYDPLTNLGNRRLLMREIQRVLHEIEKTQEMAALLFIDLDYFKNLNDTLGHSVGDELLRQVAIRLLSNIRSIDTVVRFGGDEFVILLDHLSSEQHESREQVLMIAHSVRSQLLLPYELNNSHYQISPSIGIAFIHSHEQSTEQLLSQADAAMYRAKALGRNQICIYDEQMQREFADRIRLERELREVLTPQAILTTEYEEQLILYFQPQCDQFGRIIGAESLLRWIHPERGFISPARFIPIAEESDLILQIGEKVLYQACSLIYLLEKTYPQAEFNISVNICPRQFYQAEFSKQVQSILAQTGASPRFLTIEITEGLLINDVDDIIRKMKQLKALGIHFSIDDFGTGYASLSYLKLLPLDELKIDRSFINDIEIDENDMVIVRTIIAMAKHLKFELIAEGVEQLSQVDRLVEEGCHHFQGFYFYKPMPKEQFLALIEEKGFLVKT